MPVCKSNEFIYLLSLSSPQRENIVNVSFPLKRFSFAEVQYFCLDRRPKDVGKGDCHLCTHGKALQEIGVHNTVGLCVSAATFPLYYLLPYACLLGSVRQTLRFIGLRWYLDTRNQYLTRYFTVGFKIQAVRDSVKEIIKLRWSR